MEVCGTAHFWARGLTRQGFTVRLLPSQYVRPYRRRNKTDRADTAALLEAERCGEILALEARIGRIEKLLAAEAHDNATVQALLTVPAL